MRAERTRQFTVKVLNENLKGYNKIWRLDSSLWKLVLHLQDESMAWITFEFHTYNRQAYTHTYSYTYAHIHRGTSSDEGPSKKSLWKMYTIKNLHGFHAFGTKANIFLLDISPNACHSWAGLGCRQEIGILSVSPQWSDEPQLLKPIPAPSQGVAYQEPDVSSWAGTPAQRLWDRMKMAHETS